MFANMLTGQFELTAIGLLLLILYASSKVFSRAPLYLVTGIYLVFTVISDLPNVIGLAVLPSHADSIAGTLWIPVLVLFLIIYERDGTLTTHQFFFGLALLFCFFLCLSTIFANEAGLKMNPLLWLLSAEGTHIIVHGLIVVTLILLVTHVLLLLLLPVVYQSLRNLRLPYFFALFAAIAVYLVLNEIIASLILRPLVTGSTTDFDLVQHFRLWPGRLLSIAILSLMGHAFLRYTDKDSHPFFRRNLSIFTELSTYLKNTSQMRQDIEEWTERYNIVMQFSNELICLMSPDGAILNANRKATDILGAQLGLPTFRLWSLIATEKGETIPWPDIVKLLAARTNYRHELDLRDLSLEADDKHRYDIDLHLTLVNQEGRHTILFIANDITARREEEQRRLNMAESVIHSQRLESIGILAGGVAHEFNNLLLSCRASIDLLFQHNRLHDDDRKLLDTVNDACTRSAHLTSQLLGFARRGKHTEEPVELRHLIEHILALFRPLAKNIELKVICQPVPLVVLGDEKQLGQVLLNLLINSRDPCRDTEEPRIIIRAEIVTDDMPGWELSQDRQANPEDYLCLRVRDNGQGMAPEVKSKIFEPFFTTKGPGAGTGMGLAMVFGTVNQHHGWINVVSSPGQGATFELFLPRTESLPDNPSHHHGEKS